MSLTRQDIEKVALLARLRLTHEEAETMAGELGKVIAFVDQLAEANTEAVEPMAHAIELRNVFRKDQVAASLTREEALANAPHHDDRGYLVPAVLGE
jgi:aspartyl-tRNA(Asn)/glutamyl-tRNA(Gln) amidotransferase subunit C